MSGYRLSPVADSRLDEIYNHMRARWGDAQAERYVRGLFECFQAIADRRLPWRAIPAELEIDGHYCRYERHFIYWVEKADGTIGISTILHERMHQIERFRGDMRG